MAKLDEPGFAESLAELLSRGLTNAEVAEALDAHEKSIPRWARSPKVQAHLTRLREERVNRVTRKLDAQIEARLNDPEALRMMDMKDLVALRRELLGPAAQRLVVHKGADEAEATAELYRVLSGNPELAAALGTEAVGELEPGDFEDVEPDDIEPDQFAALAAADPAAAARVIADVRKTLMVPHTGGQDLVAASQARFKVIRAGRRWGKTKLAARELVMNAVAHPDSMNWWVANTYKNVRRGYREVLRQLPRAMLAKAPPPPTSNELIIQLKNGAIIEFYSGGNPDAMAGEGVDYVVVDEAALQDEHVWNQIIGPTLMTTKGRAMLISTPRGRNWFWRMWNQGQDPNNPLYESWHFTTADTPFVDEAELELWKQSMPERLYKQEVLAEFLTLADTIFNLDSDAVRIATDTGDPYGHITMGVDLAKHQDYTVIRASRPDGRVVWHERMTGVGWPEQKARIVDAAEFLLEYGGETLTIGIDALGPGDVIYDELDEEGFDVEPIKATNSWKYQAVKLLGSDIERGRVELLEDQLPEFEAYEYTITPSGNMVYSAPDGQHDDEVSATMLEHWVRRHAVSDATMKVDNVALEDPAEEELPDVVARSAAELMQDDAVWTSA